VLGGHTGLLVSDAEQPLFRWIFNGNLGVRFFFVISGFLITWLLLQETMESGRINLRHFYLRRFLRILPVYFMLFWCCWGSSYLPGSGKPRAGLAGNVDFLPEII